MLKNKKYSVKRLCVEAMMVALYFAFDMLSSQLTPLFSAMFGGNIRISLSGIPIIIAAVIFGPLSGGVVGLLGSFLGQMLAYGITATTILWVLPDCIYGIVLGLLFMVFRKRTDFLHFCPVVVISSVILTMLNTLSIYLDGKIYGYFTPAIFSVQLLSRITIGVITAVVLSIILPPILKALRKIIKY